MVSELGFLRQDGGTTVISNRDRVTYNEVADYYNSNKVLFGIKFLKNWFLERLASSFPVPSWRAKLHKMRGVNVGKNVYIGYDVIFDRIHPELITIGDYAEIGDRCILSAHTRGSLTTRDAYPRSTAPINIGNGVSINPGCIITQGVEIGENSIIGIGSVVSRDISPNSLALGFPARVIKKLDVGPWGAAAENHTQKDDSHLHQNKSNDAVSSDLPSDSAPRKGAVGEIKI
ncbi:acyltransferase [Methanosarcina sp. KYL-1]|uniref:acyltransferase n=1 Tax=Methanosarcina sp. KYL-1 TaxID=2602068 RepID=UPI00210191FD|nr:acyltransferase [Methanosarcina sp. KYL-1]MCQ1535229.1 acyltransferase [Methanosarcina sp. KYL-1]